MRNQVQADNKMKATESAPMDTKQKNDIGVRNQTTQVPKKRFPLTLIVVLGLMLLMVGFIVFFMSGMA